MKFKHKHKNRVVVTDVYRVTFTGSRQPGFVVADSFAEAAKVASLLCDDDTSTSVLSITWIEPACVLKSF